MFSGDVEIEERETQSDFAMGGGCEVIDCLGNEGEGLEEELLGNEGDGGWRSEVRRGDESSGGGAFGVMVRSRNCDGAVLCLEDVEEESQRTDE